MNPSVQSALIAAGVSLVSLAGTVVVAVSGFRNTRRVSIQTSLTAADTAHRDRLWEKQAATYEAALATLLYRQAKRQDQLRMIRYDEEYEKRLAEFFDSFNEGQWFEVQARILAYASHEVIGGPEAARMADVVVRGRYDMWKVLAGQAKEGNALRGQGVAAPVQDGQAVIQALKDVNPALRGAVATDEALIALIQADLHRKPSQALTPLEPPPEPWPGLMGPPDPA